MVPDEEGVSTETQLSLIINAVDDGVIIIDRHGVITGFNRPAGAILDVSPSRAIGSHINKIFPEAGLLEVLAEGASIRERKVDHLQPGASGRVVITAQPLTKSGSLTGVVATIKANPQPGSFRARTAGAENVMFAEIVGNSPQLVAAKNKALRVAGSSSSVLIRGESGTGKELFARAIHHASKRKQEGFVSINCAAIPADLLESELFGYEPGAFTGAQRGGRSGKFELAHRGTVFLDEVGDMTTELQVKILRVLQDGRFFRVGGLKEVAVDVRILAATNQDLEQLIATGRFREDLFYRLNVIPLEIPALRERRDDILLLVDHFVAKYNARLQKSIRGVNADALEQLLEYSWPGNVRELENVIEYAVNMELSELITPLSLPVGMVDPLTGAVPPVYGLSEMLEHHESRIIKACLDRCGWDTAGKLRAASELGIGKTTLYTKLKKLRLDRS